MGIATVAVYSDADKRRAACEMADEAVRIGPAAFGGVAICRSTGSSQPCQDTGASRPSRPRLPVRERDFARGPGQGRHRLHRPDAHAIAAMGDKIEFEEARRRRPGQHRPRLSRRDRDADEAVEIAREIGYPVMIKASAGGGGKGMRLACRRPGMREGFVSRRNEARATFGDDRVFIEKFHRASRAISRSRCWATRTAMCPSGRARMLDPAPPPEGDRGGAEPVSRRMPCARRWASRRWPWPRRSATSRPARSSSSSTPRRNFYFLEMNTRLQVEHPVTELVTGLDLVELMIRIAAGEKLPFARSDMHAQGLGGRGAHLCRGSLSQLPALDRPSDALSGRRPGQRPRARRHRRLRRRRDQHLLRPDDRQAVHPWRRPRRSDRRHMRARSTSICIAASTTTSRSWRRYGASAVPEGELTTNFIAEEYPDGFTGRPLDARADAAFCGAAVAANLRTQRAGAISGTLNGAAPARHGLRRRARIARCMGRPMRVGGFLCLTVKPIDCASDRMCRPSP